MAVKPGHLLSVMLITVTQHFNGKYDRQGLPYVLHCIRVMDFMDSDDEELLCMALGHDLIEDTKVTYAMLRELGMTERIIEGIRCMTRLPGETEDEYQARVMSNKDSVKIKLGDLRHNTDIRRLKGVTEKDLARLQKYHTFYLKLKALG